MLCFELGVNIQQFQFGQPIIIFIKTKKFFNLIPYNIVNTIDYVSTDADFQQRSVFAHTPSLCCLDLAKLSRSEIFFCLIPQNHLDLSVIVC